MVNIVWVLCGTSLIRWFKSFISNNNNKIVLWDEFNNNIDDVISKIQKFKPQENKVIFVSTHISLKRDLQLAKVLMAMKYMVCCQNSRAVKIGLDKLLTKEFLFNHSINTPEILHIDGDSKEIGVIKYRYGTASNKIEMYDKSNSLGKDYFVEKYCEGVEYSINIFSKDNKNVVFPVVYKGRNSMQLVPPYKRMRICSPRQNGSVYHKLIEISLKIAKLLGNDGFMEVEFLITSTGEIMVLEINPRLSGTLRMSSMAAGIKCFDLYENCVEDIVLTSKFSVIEVPCSKQYIQHDCFVTSRASILFYSIDDLRNKLDELFCDDEVTNIINKYLDFDK